MLAPLYHLYLLIISDWLMLSLMSRLAAKSPAFADYNYLFFAALRLIQGW